MAVLTFVLLCASFPSSLAACKVGRVRVSQVVVVTTRLRLVLGRPILHQSVERRSPSHQSEVNACCRLDFFSQFIDAS